MDNSFAKKTTKKQLNIFFFYLIIFRCGVDGIITNHPERLINVLKEPDFALKYRMATQDDDPWERMQADPEEKPSLSAPTGQPVSMRVVASAADMLASFTKYIRDLFWLRMITYQTTTTSNAGNATGRSNT